jgi:hypothetical protein
MNQYHHHVSGIFQRHAEAATALLQLKEKGLPLRRMQIYEENISVPKATTQGKSNEVLKSMFVKGIIGTVVGAGLGALAQIALVSPNLTLFFASPLVAPISMLGWGASLGAIIGAIIGAIKSDKSHPNEKGAWFSDLVGDAVVNDQVVLVVETRSQKETELAGEVMRLSVNNYKDVSVA